jgi:hypothetical protein
MASSVGPFSHELGSFFRSEVRSVLSAWKGENTNYLPRLQLSQLHFAAILEYKYIPPPPVVHLECRFCFSRNAKLLLGPFWDVQQLNFGACSQADSD